MLSFHVTQQQPGEFRWRLAGGDGGTLAKCREPFPTFEACAAGIEAFRAALTDAELVESPEETQKPPAVPVDAGTADVAGSPETKP